MTLKRQLQPDTKLQELCNRLRALAHEKGPGVQLPTMRTLCEEFKTTRVTLGEALDQLEAEHVLYRKERQGIFVSPRLHYKAIHIFFDSSLFTASVISPFWTLLLVRLEQEVQRRSTFKHETCQIHLVRPLPDSENSLPEEVRTLLETERVDGILAVGLNTKEKGWFTRWPVPCVTFAGNSTVRVQLDMVEFGRQAALALLRQGCQRLGLWNVAIPLYHTLSPEVSEPDVPIQQLNDMYEVVGFHQVLAEQKAPVYRELFRHPHTPPFQRPLTYQEQGYLLAREVFGSTNSPRPDGLLITNDMLTDGALVAFDELGIRPGKDVKIVTHANAGSPVLFGRTRNMLVLEVNATEIAQAMFSMLEQIIEGQVQPTPDMCTMVRYRVRE